MKHGLERVPEKAVVGTASRHRCFNNPRTSCHPIQVAPHRWLSLVQLHLDPAPNTITHLEPSRAQHRVVDHVLAVRHPDDQHVVDANASRPSINAARTTVHGMVESKDLGCSNRSKQATRKESCPKAPPSKPTARRRSSRAITYRKNSRRTQPAFVYLSTPSILERSWLTIESLTPVESLEEPRDLQIASNSSKIMMCLMQVRGLGVRVKRKLGQEYTVAVCKGMQKVRGGL